MPDLGPCQSWQVNLDCCEGLPEDLDLSVVVMAHKKRARLVEGLLQSLDAEAEVIWDRHDDRHDTGLRSLEAADRNADYHVVLQDDALVCRDLLAGLAVALAHVPEGAPVGLYAGRVRPVYQHMTNRFRWAAETKSSWMVGHGPVWGVGVVIPTPVIDDLVAFYRSSNAPGYDTRLCHFFRGTPCWYTVPSLVDHGAARSLIGHSPEGRVAQAFLGTDRSALDVDWSAMPVRPEPGYLSDHSSGVYSCWDCNYGALSESRMRGHVAKSHIPAMIGAT